MNNPDKAVQVLIKMNPNTNVDAESFSKEVRDIFEQLRTTSPEDLEIGPLLKETLATANRHHLEIPTDFVLYAKTVSIIEGIALRYQPHFNFSKESKKILKELVGPEFVAREVMDRAMGKMSEYKELADMFPQTAKEILEKARKFKLQIDVSDTDISSLTAELERSSGNLALGMIKIGR